MTTTIVTGPLSDNATEESLVAVAASDGAGGIASADKKSTMYSLSVRPISNFSKREADGKTLTLGTFIVTALITQAVTAATPAPASPPSANTKFSLTYNDGFADASAGAPQFPNLFAHYSTRPAWKVAGVDYAVGVPNGTALKDPITISQRGVSVDASAHIVWISGNNVTLNGYDFSLNGGYGLYIKPGSSDTVIENSKFVVGTNLRVPIAAEANTGSLTVLHCTFDSSNNSEKVWAYISSSNSGAFTAEYDDFRNAASDDIDLGNGATTPVIQYNVAYNQGTNLESHPDFVQFVGNVVNNAIIQFNTIYQPQGNEQPGMEGIQIAAQNGSTVTNTMVRNNVVVAQGPRLSMSYSIAIQQADDNRLDGVAITNNYIDAIAAFGPIYPPSGSNLTFSNNINLATGAHIANPPGTSDSDVTSITSLPRSGKVSAGNTISFMLIMDAPMIVTGTPTLALNRGGIASYVSGSGTPQLSFNYTAASKGGAASLGITGVTLPDGSAITDSAGNRANLSGAKATFTGLSIVP